MIYAAYNSIPMRSLGEIGYRREVLWTDDGSQAYGISVDFQGVFAVNPGLMSHNDGRGNFEPDVEGDVAAAGRFNPNLPNWPTADLLLLVQHRLQQPRKPLVIWTYTGQGGKPARPNAGPIDAGARKVILLRSPEKTFEARLRGGGAQHPPQGGKEAEYMESDIKDGPKPILMWHTFDHGQGTVLVGWAVHTDIPFPLPDGVSSSHSSVLLANRWTMRQDLDEHFFAIHRIEGRAIFHKGILDMVKMTPDALRSMFIHPVPLGFRRHDIAVIPDSSGHAVDYSFNDVEQPVDQPGVAAFGASKVEVTHQREHTMPSPSSLLTG